MIFAETRASRLHTTPAQRLFSGLVPIAEEPAKVRRSRKLNERPIGHQLHRNASKRGLNPPIALAGSEGLACPGHRSCLA